MTNILWSLIAFLVALGVLITVHEFGHFWVARRCGVKVER
ncbi:MAG: site-2 protease family protein, partial [Hafnia sp.]